MKVIYKKIHFLSLWLIGFQTSGDALALFGTHIPPRDSILRFADKLVKREFGSFFIYPQHNTTVSKIWSSTVHQAMLDEIVEDSLLPMETRFLACEILRANDFFYTRKHSIEKIAKIYANALIHNYTQRANSWGLLYNGMDDGPVGYYFILMREYAVKELMILLENNSSGPAYEGSIEATLGNGYNYRIKDFAAYYLGRIIGKPLKYYQEFQERDAQIIRLKKDLATFDFNKK